MEYRIGFKGKYYKLFEYEIKYLEENGKTYKYECYSFVKVISMSKEKTIEKYPDVPFDEFCNDRRYSTFYKRTLIIKNDKFHCGKYAGKCFNMCDDYDYMKWFYNSCATEEQKDIIKPILLDNNYVLVDNEFYSVEKLEKDANKESQKNKTLEKLSKNLPFISSVEKNINTSGDYFDKQLQIKLHFEKYKTSYWDELYYGMPIDNKGKAKRIKGKQILVIKYTLSDNIVNIEEWKFA